jgi:hypothetical protein
MIYQVWCEGYQTSGNSDTAVLEGEIRAESFTEACIKLLGDRLDKNPDGSYRLSRWGCRLFDNEAEARASFG